ncbi:hypothetical protein [Aminobacter ciceronei]|jgi:hypothetical protein|uniref:hypothetical protein n=1 Tax=Aminobacter ciceronei TaxID=150723 RepID=UPI003F6F340A
MRITAEQRENWAQNTASSPFNQWLDAQIRGPDGRLDLDRLHQVSRRYGVDRQAQYAHLNPGQQRMTIGNVLRRVVPHTEYERGPAAEQKDQPTVERPPFMRVASVRDLLILHSQIMDELRERDIVRTANAPLGDYAELLFATAFGWSLEGNSSTGHDATDAAGIRYQVKSRRLTPRNPSRQLSAIRRLPEHTFDFVAGVLFDELYRVTKAILIPHAVIVARAKRVEHTNSWRFMLDDRVWQIEGTLDVTADIARAAAEI